MGVAPAPEAVSWRAVGDKDATYVEKVKLISGATNAVCKEKDVPLQP